MGKKTPSPDQITSTQQQLKQASLKLERHLFHTHSKAINSLIELSDQNISFSTYEKYKDLLLQTKRYTLLTSNSKAEEDHCQDSDDLDEQIKRKERLPSQFSEMLTRSQSSYERTSLIMRNMSLKQKYRYLLGESQAQQQKIDVKLEVEEQTTLRKIKKLYKHYKVSNMFKKNVCAKIRQSIVQKLIKKGFIREQNGILTLKS